MLPLQTTLGAPLHTLTVRTASWSHRPRLERRPVGALRYAQHRAASRWHSARRQAHHLDRLVVGLDSNFSVSFSSAQSLTVLIAVPCGCTATSHRYVTLGKWRTPVRRNPRSPRPGRRPRERFSLAPPVIAALSGGDAAAGPLHGARHRGRRPGRRPTTEDCPAGRHPPRSKPSPTQWWPGSTRRSLVQLHAVTSRDILVPPYQRIHRSPSLYDSPALEHLLPDLLGTIERPGVDRRSPTRWSPSTRVSTRPPSRDVDRMGTVRVSRPDIPTCRVPYRRDRGADLCGYLRTVK